MDVSIDIRIKRSNIKAVMFGFVIMFYGAVSASNPNKNTAPPTLVLVYGQMSQTGPRIVEELEYMKQLNIPADISVNLDNKPEVMAAINEWSDRGNIVSPAFYPATVDANYPNRNWHAYDEETCFKLLTKAKQMAIERGFRNFDAIDTYTPGNGFVKAAKRVGIHHLTGFCGPEVGDDSGWKLNHTGAPLIPYFASNEDFRKPEQPKDDNWFQIVNMEHRNPLTCLEHWNEGPLDPLNLIMGDRSIEPGDDPIETMATVNDWMELTRMTGVTRLIIVDLQYFTSEKTYPLNRRFLSWLADQRDLGKIRFVGIKEIAKMNLENKGLAPQTLWWRGENMGMLCGGQPGDGQPGISKETIDGQLIWKVGNAGPERYYDYRKTWNYPPYDITGTKPESFGYKADLHFTREIVGNVVEVALDWKTSQRGSVDLCAWKALEGLAAPFKITSTEGLTSAEVLPHPAGNGGAILFNAAMSAGKGKIRIEFSGKGGDNQTRRWEDMVAVETTHLKGRDITRFAPLVPFQFSFPIRIKGYTPVRWESIHHGRTQSGLLFPGDSLSVVLDGTRAASLFRMWDAKASDLIAPDVSMKKERERLLTEVKATAAALAPNSPQPTTLPMLGFDAQIPQWAWLAAKKGADIEIQKVEEARAKYAPGIAVASYHMACDIPYNGRTRARNIYDRSEKTTKGEIFSEYYDYGHSFAPGVAGWDQFWEVRIGIRNFQPGKPLRMVFHTWDPDSLGTQVRIFACSASDKEGLKPEGKPVTLKPRFKVAQGFDARLGADAFVTVDIPAELTKGESVVINLRGNSELRKFDRLTEGFGYVLLSHAWLMEK